MTLFPLLTESGRSRRGLLAFGANQLSYGQVQSSRHVDEAIRGDFSNELELKGFDTDLRYHPWQNGFYGGFGMRFNQNRLTSVTRLNNGDKLVINGTIFNHLSLRELRYENTYNTFAPRLTFGYDGSLHRDSKWSLKLGFGLLYQGQAKQSRSYTLGAAGALTGGNVAKSLEGVGFYQSDEKLDRKWWPLAMIGLSYRF